VFFDCFAQPNCASQGWPPAIRSGHDAPVLSASGVLFALGRGGGIPHQESIVIPGLLGLGLYGKVPDATTGAAFPQVSRSGQANDKLVAP
jgi:hypothetical protein